MPANYVLLRRVVTTTTVSTIDILNIPTTGYTDLVVKWSTRTPNTTPTNDNILIAFNGSAGNGNHRVLYGNGSAVSTSTDTGTYTAAGTTGSAAGADIYSSGQLYISNYAGSTFKGMNLETVTENNSTTAGLALNTFLWNQTAAISSITLVPNFANFSANSTFSIYGVARLGTDPVIAPKATGGDIVTTDGTYWYHTFFNTSVLTPNQTISNVDFLVLAGGGSGGFNWGGGGGAGGFRTSAGTSGGGGSAESKLTLLAQAYPVTIGAGGSGQAGFGSAGSNSIFSTITSIGGGIGGGSGGNSATACAGGSGGGGSRDNTFPGGDGTANQGYRGGRGDTGGSNKLNSGGGGGAGSVGADGNGAGNGTSGNGGSGVASSISGTSVTYAGGGGGGGYSDQGRFAGSGTDGGGNGNAATGGTGGNATAFTGSGGGGGGAADGRGGNGASGLVIVRYTVA